MDESGILSYRPEELDGAYHDMAADEQREKEALGWSEGLIADVNDEAR